MHVEINRIDSTHHFDNQDAIADVISESLSRFSDKLTRVEAYFKDVNGPKQGIDQQCTLEARLEMRKEPLVVGATGATVEQALDEATDKMVTLLSKTVEKLREKR